MKKNTLGSQLFILLFVTVLGALLIITLLGIGSLKDSFYQQSTHDLQEETTLFAHFVSSSDIQYSPEKLKNYCNSISKGTSTSITFMEINGTIAASSESFPELLQDQSTMPEVKAFLKTYEPTSHVRYSNQTSKEMIFVTAPVFDHNGKLSMILRMGFATDTIIERLTSLYLRIFIISSIVLAIAALLGIIISGNLGRLLFSIRQVAKHYAEGDFTKKIIIHNPQELKELAWTMNKMADQLQDRFRTIIQQRNELEAMLAGMVEAVIMLDTQLRIKTMNPAASILFNITIADSIGKRMLEVFRNSQFFDFAGKTLSSDTLVEENIVIQGETKLYLQVHGTQLKGEKGHIDGILLVMNDITQLKRLENMRKDFVSNVSHELKTPITSIKGFVETLQTVPISDPEKLNHFLGIIENQTNRLSSIIEDLLTISSLEHTRPDYSDMVPYSVFDLLTNALNVCYNKAVKRNIQITMDCETNLMIKTYPTLAEQAIVNLIDNAVKYSDEGQPVIISAREKKDFIYVNVIDRGNGIPDADLPRIFERFYRVDKARSRKMGGTGLGLSIVKHIALVHGGNVEVESVLNEGSIFTIKFPRILQD